MNEDMLSWISLMFKLWEGLNDSGPLTPNPKATQRRKTKVLPLNNLLRIQNQATLILTMDTARQSRSCLRVHATLQWTPMLLVTPDRNVSSPRRRREPSRSSEEVHPNRAPSGQQIHLNPPHEQEHSHFRSPDPEISPFKEEDPTSTRFST